MIPSVRIIHQVLQYVLLASKQNQMMRMSNFFLQIIIFDNEGGGLMHKILYESKK